MCHCLFHVKACPRASHWPHIRNSSTHLKHDVCSADKHQNVAQCRGAGAGMSFETHTVMLLMGIEMATGISPRSSGQDKLQAQSKVCQAPCCIYNCKVRFKLFALQVHILL